MKLIELTDEIAQDLNIWRFRKVPIYPPWSWRSRYDVRRVKRARRWAAQYFARHGHGRGQNPYRGYDLVIPFRAQLGEFKAYYGSSA